MTGTTSVDLGLPDGVEPTPLALLLLGRGADPESERGVECPGDLPAPSDPDLVERATAAKAALADSDVATIQRLNTKGGVADGPCEQAGTFLNAPYSADYMFYSKKS